MLRKGGRWTMRSEICRMMQKGIESRTMCREGEQAGCCAMNEDCKQYDVDGGEWQTG